MILIVLLAIVAILSIWKDRWYKRKVFPIWFVGLLTLLTIFVVVIRGIHDSNTQAKIDVMYDKINELHAELYQKNQIIAELAQANLLIRSIQIQIQLDVPTPSRPLTDLSTSVGRASAIALFSQDTIRFRFITDYKYTCQQISGNTNRLTFIYYPETPEQLLGKRIEFLEEMHKLVVNYSEFLSSNEIPKNKIITIYFNVTINGILILSHAENEAYPGVLANGQAVLDVSHLFNDIFDKYVNKVRSMLKE